MIDKKIESKKDNMVDYVGNPDKLLSEVDAF